MPKYNVTVRESRSYEVTIDAEDKSEAVMSAIWKIENDKAIEPDQIAIDAEDCDATLIREAV
jgi:hypothetical protein